MVININPNRINVSSGAAGRQQRQLASPDAYKAPKRSEINHVPAPESLRTLIGGAVAALKAGVYWDRGTILNLLV